MVTPQWHHPQALKEALGLLGRHGSQALPVAGATALALRKKLGQAHLIDLSNCDLDTIAATAAKITVGAMTRVGDLIPAVLPGVEGAFLASVAGGIAATPLRTMISVGGNLAGGHPWADLPVVLAALDASLELKTARRKRTIPVAEFMVSPASTTLAKGELITAVEVPRSKGAIGWGYQQLRRTATDYSMLNVAVWLKVSRGTIAAARIVTGAARPRPTMLEDAAAALIGAKLDAQGRVADEVLAAAAAAAMRAVNPAPDMRASKTYRREMLGVLSRRAVTDALGRVGGA